MTTDRTLDKPTANGTKPAEKELETFPVETTTELSPETVEKLFMEFINGRSKIEQKFITMTKRNDGGAVIRHVDK